ncbi:Hypothetical protein PHPALM_36729 [Phytophthora palmivora]|uniref:Uncharacterized protein n=1 Tax=Phytophthora palmivora TaxID=4796 RepID=A0A2P4WZ70_9STRA|nr:Hypothetical protein PHPALM_36729 [Phytophthora palmivora]
MQGSFELYAVKLKISLTHLNSWAKKREYTNYVFVRQHLNATTFSQEQNMKKQQDQPEKSRQCCRSTYKIKGNQNLGRSSRKQGGKRNDSGGTFAYWNCHQTGDIQFVHALDMMIVSLRRNFPHAWQ